MLPKFGGKGKVSLSTRTKRQPLILKTDRQDKGWMTRYFFVEIDSMGEENRWLLSNWKVKGKNCDYVFWIPILDSDFGFSHFLFLCRNFS